MGSPGPLDAPLPRLLVLLRGDCWSCEILTTGQVQGKSCSSSLKQHLGWGQMTPPPPRMTWGLRLGHRHTETVQKSWGAGGNVQSSMRSGSAPLNPLSTLLFPVKVLRRG